MGNRARIVFFDAHRVSPTVYLHWHGDAVPGWLSELKVRMTGRFSDASYAAARFTGFCHNQIPGNLSLGLDSNAYRRCDLQDPDVMTAESPGDAGIIVVDTSNFSWRAYGGYLAQSLSQQQEN